MLIEEGVKEFVSHVNAYIFQMEQIICSNDPKSDSTNLKNSARKVERGLSELMACNHGLFEKILVFAFESFEDSFKFVESLKKNPKKTAELGCCYNRVINLVAEYKMNDFE